MAGRLIVVSNRLPISISENKDGGLDYKPSPGGMAAALNPVLRDKTTVWVGWNGMNRALDPEELQGLQVPDQLFPINLEHNLYRAYYDNFANGSLWPTLHGFTPRRMYSPQDWDASLAVTKRFAAEVMSLADPDDIIWIHDFHLIMLPKFLREAGCTNRIGYFLHIPFAKPDLFEMLPNHPEMLESLQAADVCGFQTAPDVENFLTCFRKVMGSNASLPICRPFAVGIDYDRYHGASRMEAVRRNLATFKKRFAGKTLILSASRLDYTKGIIQQLEGIRGVIAQAPDRQKHVYKLVVAPSREDLTEYQDLKDEIGTTVDAINHEFADSDWQPIEYEYRNMPFEELAALYCLADVMVVVPLIDGMNLIAKEYVAAKPEDDGVLVLSKLAGAAKQLTEAVLVDPNDTDDITDALRRAVAMPAAERKRRHAAMRANVKREDAYWWAQEFTDTLRSVPR